MVSVFFGTSIAGFAVAYQLGKDDLFSPPQVLGAIGVGLAMTFSAAWFFAGDALTKWRFARALRVADRKRAVVSDGISVGGASVAVTAIPAALESQRRPLLEGLYATQEEPETEPVER